MNYAQNQSNVVNLRLYARVKSATRFKFVVTVTSVDRFDICDNFTNKIVETKIVELFASRS